jgi:hypothetical protein
MQIVSRTAACPHRLCQAQTEGLCGLETPEADKFVAFLRSPDDAPLFAAPGF